MLTKIDVEKLAKNYLIKNNYPICGQGEVMFPEDGEGQWIIEYLKNKHCNCFFHIKIFR